MLCHKKTARQGEINTSEQASRAPIFVWTLISPRRWLKKIIFHFYRHCFLRAFFLLCATFPLNTFWQTLNHTAKEFSEKQERSWRRVPFCCTEQNVFFFFFYFFFLYISISKQVKQKSSGSRLAHERACKDWPLCPSGGALISVSTLLMPGETELTPHMTRTFHCGLVLTLASVFIDCVHTRRNSIGKPHLFMLFSTV